MTGTGFRAFQLLGFCLLALLASTSRAHAAEEVQEYLVAYRAYSAALGSGDAAGAIRHARNAWDAAEQELGAHRLTAILAYNYGRLVVFRDAASADAALQRSRELLETGIADLSAKHVNVYADYARFIAGGTTRRAADRLRDTLTAAGMEDPELISDLAPMWLRLAAHDAVEERYRKAEDSAAMAEAAILKASPESKRALAEAIVLRGIAELVPYPRKVDDVQAAHNQFARARTLFGPQEDLDTFDPLLAQIIAWDNAAGSALRNLGEEDYPDHEGTDQQEYEGLSVFRRDADSAVECGEIEWAEQSAPDYPRNALREGYLGAALIGYRLGDDLLVHDARILAEVPQEAFGEAALEAVKSWRARALPEGGAVCRQNLLMTIRFVLED